MTFPEIAQMITALGVFLTAIVGAMNLVWTKRNGVKIEEVHKSTNGKMDALIELTAKSSKAEGRKEAIDEQKG